jgi:hypothetical protein
MFPHLLYKNVRVKYARKIFGCKSHDEVTGESSIMKSLIFCMYSSLNIITVVKQRRLRWAVYISCM